jgi:hypothetical protein
MRSRRWSDCECAPVAFANSSIRLGTVVQQISDPHFRGYVHTSGQHIAHSYSEKHILRGRIVGTLRFAHTRYFPFVISVGMRHAPIPSVISCRIVDVALRRIAIDQRPEKERMLHTAHFVFDCKQRFLFIRINYVLESVLMLVALLGEQLHQG